MAFAGPARPAPWKPDRRAGRSVAEPGAAAGRRRGGGPAAKRSGWKARRPPPDSQRAAGPGTPELAAGGVRGARDAEPAEI